MKMGIIKATENDLEDLVKLNSILHLDMPDFVWETPEWILEQIKQGNYYVFQKDGYINGAICIDCDPIYEEKAFIEALAVFPEKQRKGVGRKLVEFAKQQAIIEGKKELVVNSFCEYDTEDFYEKCGFIQDLETYFSNTPHPFFAFAFDLDQEL